MNIAKKTITCPFCKELINAAATRCKHCHSDLKPAEGTGKPLFAKYNNFRVGFLLGILFSLAITVLFYLQFFSD